MKGSFKLHEAQEKKKAEEPELERQPCVICNKMLAGAYGRFNSDDGELWSCSKTCDQQYKEQRDANSKCT